MNVAHNELLEEARVVLARAARWIDKANSEHDRDLANHCLEFVAEDVVEASRHIAAARAALNALETT